MDDDDGWTTDACLYNKLTYGDLTKQIYNFTMSISISLLKRDICFKCQLNAFCNAISEVQLTKPLLKGSLPLHHQTYELRREKNNKISVRPAKTQINLGICPVWSKSSLSAWRKLGSLTTHWAHSEDSDQTGGCPGWSESSLGTNSFCWFCHVVAHID